MHGPIKMIEANELLRCKYMKKAMMQVLYQFSISLMINTNDLRLVVDEELATINFNIWT